MNDYTFCLDELLKPAILSNIVLTIDGNNYKEGILISFGYNFFNLNVNIKNKRKNKTDILKIPLPFEFHRKGDIILFDYRLKTFVRNNKEIEIALDDIKKPCISKFYDKILSIQVT